MDTAQVTQRFATLAPFLDERLRRVLAAAEAEVLGYGGVSAVARATGVSRRAITQGLNELRAPQQAAPPERTRRAGGGRKSVLAQYETLPAVLESLVEPLSRGDPQAPLRWTLKSARVLARELAALGYPVSHNVVAHLLHELGYSLQSTRKTREGGQHPERNAQFIHINAEVARFQAAGEPVISVDAKKKELLGDFQNKGREWCRQGHAEEVRVYDFALQGDLKAPPYGIYDVTANIGWVNVGLDKDTAAFAVASIRRWWEGLGCQLYARARQLLITADGGGSNGSRVRLWKVEL